MHLDQKRDITSFCFNFYFEILNNFMKNMTQTIQNFSVAQSTCTNIVKATT